jgi:WhiB family redox-sensing transcriptional regulator
MGRKPELPGAVEWAWEWQERAACADRDTRLFFHPEGERGPTFEAREEAAKRVCRRCPVADACRAYALAVREPYGVWGGLSESERDDLRRRGRHPGHQRASAA